MIYCIVVVYGHIPGHAYTIRVFDGYCGPHLSRRLLRLSGPSHFGQLEQGDGSIVRT